MMEDIGMLSKSASLLTSPRRKGFGVLRQYMNNPDVRDLVYPPIMPFRGKRERDHMFRVEDRMPSYIVRAKLLQVAIQAAHNQFNKQLIAGAAATAGAAGLGYLGYKYLPSLTHLRNNKGMTDLDEEERPMNAQGATKSAGLLDSPLTTARDYLRLVHNNPVYLTDAPNTPVHIKSILRPKPIKGDLASGTLLQAHSQNTFNGMQALSLRRDMKNQARQLADEQRQNQIMVGGAAAAGITGLGYLGHKYLSKKHEPMKEEETKETKATKSANLPVPMSTPTISPTDLMPKGISAMPNAAQGVTLPPSRPLVAAQPGDPSFTVKAPEGPKGLPNTGSAQGGQTAPTPPPAGQPPPQQPAPQATPGAFKPSPLVTLYGNDPNAPDVQTYAKFVPPAPPPNDVGQPKTAGELPMDSLADIAARYKIASMNAIKPSKPSIPVPPVQPKPPVIKKPSKPAKLASDRQVKHGDTQGGHGGHQVDAMSQQVEAWGNQVKTADDQVDTTSQQVDAMSQQVDATSYQVKACGNQVKTADDQVDAMSQQVKAWGNQVKTADDQVDTNTPHGLSVTVTTMPIFRPKSIPTHMFGKIANMLSYAQPFDPLSYDLTTGADPMSVMTHGNVGQFTHGNHDITDHAIGRGHHPGIRGRDPGRSTGYLDPSTRRQVRNAIASSRIALDIASPPIARSFFDHDRFKTLAQMASVGDHRAYSQMKQMTDALNETNQDPYTARMAKLRMDDLELQNPGLGKIAQVIDLAVTSKKILGMNKSALDPETIYNTAMARIRQGVPEQYLDRHAAGAGGLLSRLLRSGSKLVDHGKATVEGVLGSPQVNNARGVRDAIRNRSFYQMAHGLQNDALGEFRTAGTNDYGALNRESAMNHLIDVGKHVQETHKLTHEGVPSQYQPLITAYKAPKGMMRPLTGPAQHKIDLISKSAGLLDMFRGRQAPIDPNVLPKTAQVIDLAVTSKKILMTKSAAPKWMKMLNSDKLSPEALKIAAAKIKQAADQTATQFDESNVKQREPPDETTWEPSGRRPVYRYGKAVGSLKSKPWHQPSTLSGVKQPSTQTAGSIGTATGVKQPPTQPDQTAVKPAPPPTVTAEGTAEEPKALPPSRFLQTPEQPAFAQAPPRQPGMSSVKQREPPDETTWEPSGRRPVYRYGKAVGSLKSSPSSTLSGVKQPSTQPDQTAVKLPPPATVATAAGAQPSRFEPGPPQPRFEPGPPQPRFEPGPAQPRFEPGPPQPRFATGPPQPRFEPGPPQPRFEPGPAQPRFEPGPPQPRFATVSTPIQRSAPAEPGPSQPRFATVSTPIQRSAPVVSAPGAPSQPTAPKPSALSQSTAPTPIQLPPKPSAPSQLPSAPAEAPSALSQPSAPSQPTAPKPSVGGSGPAKSISKMAAARKIAAIVKSADQPEDRGGSHSHYLNQGTENPDTFETSFPQRSYADPTIRTLPAASNTGFKSNQQPGSVSETGGVGANTSVQTGYGGAIKIPAKTAAPSPVALAAPAAPAAPGAQPQPKVDKQQQAGAPVSKWWRARQGLAPAAPAAPTAPAAPQQPYVSKRWQANQDVAREFNKQNPGLARRPGENIQDLTARRQAWAEQNPRANAAYNSSLSMAGSNNYYQNAAANQQNATQGQGNVQLPSKAWLNRFQSGSYQNAAADQQNATQGQLPSSMTGQGYSDMARQGYGYSAMAEQGYGGAATPANRVANAAGVRRTPGRTQVGSASTTGRQLTPSAAPSPPPTASAPGGFVTGSGGGTPPSRPSSGSKTGIGDTANATPKVNAGEGSNKPSFS